MNSLTIRIYIASLHHYNCGELRGAWIELPCSDLKERIDQILAGQEEYAIHDTDVDGLDSLKIDEYDDPFLLNTQAEALAKLTDHDLLQVDYLLYEGEDLEDALDKYEDVQVYSGSIGEVAEELVAEGCFGDVPSAIINYIDYEAIARDLTYDGYIEYRNHIFHRS